METTPWHTLDTAEALRLLGTDPERGLDAEEARRRLEKFGPNEISQERKVSPLSLLLGQFKNVLILILLAAIGLSILAGEVLDGAIIGAIVLFSALLGFFQEYRAERALESLKKMLSPTVLALRDGQTAEIPAKHLVPGDVVLLEAGDKIAADGRLIETSSLKCDEAALTGESVPVSKRTEPVAAGSSLGDRRNMVFAGTVVTYGRGRAVVTATGMRTEFGKIAREVTEAEAKKTPLEIRTEEIGKWLGILALTICSLVAGLSVLREALTTSLSLPFFITTIMFAVALAVAAVPEALAAIVTGALAIGMQQMARRNALVRRMPAVETLGCTTVICSDKTGTLTRGEMTVRRVFAGGHMVEVTGVGYEPEGEFRTAGIKGNSGVPGAVRRLLEVACLCSDAVLEKRQGGWAVRGDPTEGGLIVAAVKAGLDPEELRRANPRGAEVPFSSERKRMSTLHRTAEGGIWVCVKGAPEEILKRSTRVVEDRELRPLADADRSRLLEINREMAGAALRVLAVAFRCLKAQPEDLAEGEAVEQDLVFLGLVGMMDPPRPEAIQAVATCREVGIRTVMITGDHELTAVAVARELGMYSEGDLVLGGDALHRMSEQELAEIVDRVRVYARVSPLDKLKIVRAWKSKGEIVAMTGDGVNDAPALKHADIGIAMGLTGTDVTKDAADMVLSDDNFATIVGAVERGRWIYDNIKKYLTYLLRCNVTEVAVIGGIVLLLGPEHLPLLPAAILYINLATDGLPALALGVAPPDPDLMRRPPRNPREGVFTGEVKLFILLGLLLETPVFFYLFFHRMPDLACARTQIFFVFILVELVIALNFRSMRFSIFKAPPHRWLLLAILWEILLVTGLVQLPSVREAFGIVKPSFADLASILAFCAVVFVAMEGLKAALRRRERKIETTRAA